ncbi:MAG TPA: AAA family ATPase [Candidatus Angelobacter sp.]|nr:AAA family ATPase [Candidatus Angelobacter sp.]
MARNTNIQHPPEIVAIIERTRRHLQKNGLTQRSLAARINYSDAALSHFLSGTYSWSSKRDIVDAVAQYLDKAEGIHKRKQGPAKLYETSNVRLIRQILQSALEQGTACYLRGAPGTQKTFVLENLIEDINRGAHQSQAFYIRCLSGMKPSHLMKRIALACGAMPIGTLHVVIENVRFHLEDKQSVLVFDEAQGLSFTCLELVREIYDVLGCGVLFAGSHDLESTFLKLNMQQWHSRISRGVTLPGLSRDEACDIVSTELPDFSPSDIAKLVDSCQDPDLRDGKVQNYISARKLFKTIADIQKRSAAKKGKLQ